MPHHSTYVMIFHPLQVSAKTNARLGIQSFICNKMAEVTTHKIQLTIHIQVDSTKFIAPEGFQTIHMGGMWLVGWFVQLALLHPRGRGTITMFLSEFLV